MCYFITTTISARADLAKFSEIAGRHGLSFTPIANAFVQKQLPAGLAYLEKAPGTMCDCGTVLGCLGANRQDGDTDLTREVAKLRRAGWSERKIERWLADKHKVEEKQARQDRYGAEARRQEAEAWLAFLRDALENGKVGSVGLLLHFYRTGPSSERIQLGGIARNRVRGLDAEALMRIKEDVLQLFQL
jgi:hypothetical protein